MPDDARPEPEPEAPERPQPEIPPDVTTTSPGSVHAMPDSADTLVAVPALVLGQPAEAVVAQASDVQASSDLPAPSRPLPAELADLNEAVPAEPPVAGTDPVGSIPQVSETRAWVKAQAANWRLYLIRFLCAGASVVITVLLIPGLQFSGWRWGEFVQIAVVFGLLNMAVKPALQFLSLRFIFSTYGLVVVLINTLLLFLLGVILPGLINVERPVSVLAGGLLVGVIGLVLETVLGANPPILDRDYKERNGLA